MTLQAWYENDSNIFLAMEYFPHGDLDAYIQAGVSEDGAKLICGQLLDGLSLMHQIGFTHRDLKPQVRTAPNSSWPSALWVLTHGVRNLRIFLLHLQDHIGA